MNILTFDVEEWFHVLDNDSTRTAEQWDRYPVRIHENMERIFSILEEHDTKATFFVIGWVARRYPEIVRRIAEKYEIGTHTMNHQLVWQQSPKAFREDLQLSINTIEDITGRKVRCFRAPGFSIRESETWTFETLAECGIEIDCSILPAHHAHGGFPSCSEGQPFIIESNGIRLKELPVSTRKIFGKTVVFSGGGYFRLFPYSLIRDYSSQSEDYLMSYLHPRDFDHRQPLIPGLGLLRIFKSYYGLKGAEKKLHRWLNEFNFSDIDSADKIIHWDNVPVMSVNSK